MNLQVIVIQSVSILLVLALILAVRKPLVEHEIYDHAGDADVHPQRPRPARNRSMAIIAGPQAAAQRDDYQGNDYDRKRDVRDEYDQINNMPKVVAEKADVPNVVMEIK